MGVSLTVLGTSGGCPGPAAAACGYLLRTSSTNLWIDAGAGTMANLLQHIGVSDVDGIILSHEHPDHWTDIQGFWVAAAHFVNPPVENVPVYAPTGLRDHVYAPNLQSNVFDWHECEPGDKIQVGDISITFARAQHPVLTLAMKIECEGKVLAYSADTGPAFSFRELGDHFDFAWTEANDIDEIIKRDAPDSHISGRQSAVMSKDAGVKRLMLSHIRFIADREKVLEEAKSEHPDVFLAQENRIYEI